MNPEVFTLLNGRVLPRCQEIEIASSLQIPVFQIIGLPGPEVAEAKDRIRAAIEASGFEFPRRKIIVNLSPASVRKEGTGLDLAMAIALYLEGERIAGRSPPSVSNRIFAWGELGLDGRVKPVRSPARALAAAVTGRAELILVAKSDEARFLETARTLFPEVKFPPLVGLDHFRELPQALAESRSAEHDPPRPETTTDSDSDTDSVSESLSSPRSHLLPIARTTAELLQIAAAGAHHFLLLGPKGVGKSLALEWFLALQPAPDPETIRTRRYLAEISGRDEEAPVRRIGTQVKAAALQGSFAGGALRPGEFSLAHGGVLLADEFPEWSRDAREALREPLERRRVSLTRVDGVLELPADFVFAGNGNLCPCGGQSTAPDSPTTTPCRCLPTERARYLARLSGPILDRLDLVVELRSGIANDPARRATYSDIAPPVARARRRLVLRYGLPPGKLPPERLEEILDGAPGLRERLDAIPFRSFRDRHKTLRIALTLAALRDREEPDLDILREARALRIEAGRA
ncbi:MAG: ATP-binding protein [Bdellovibrionales bacterium]|nr:ATP-binding protein [Bdellovibrionales bacterium]